MSNEELKKQMENARVNELQVITVAIGANHKSYVTTLALDSAMVKLTQIIERPVNYVNSYFTGSTLYLSKNDSVEFLITREEER